MAELGRTRWRRVCVLPSILLLVLGLAMGCGSGPSTNGRPNEGASTGEAIPVKDTDWRMGRTDQAVIAGYSSADSVSPGETVAFYVHTPLYTFDLSVYRLGWYGGVGAEKVLDVPSIKGTAQPECPKDETTGLVACAWKRSYSLKIPADWASGVYVAKLKSVDGVGSYIPFVVRGSTQGRILVVVPFFTYQAYNAWGGESLYASRRPGKQQATHVSFDRPYLDQIIQSQLLDWDLGSIQFLEKNGYPVTYVTDVDLHERDLTNSGLLGVISLGHDEYWTKEIRDHLETAVRAGTHLAIWGANSGYWQVRLEASSSGTPNRVIVCYKDPNLDPLAARDPQHATVQFRAGPVNRPESALIGAMYTGMVKLSEEAPLKVENSSHWLFEGTGLNKGDTVPRGVGVEADQVTTGSPTNVVVLFRSPYENRSGGKGVAETTIYQHPSGALVFAAGSITWGRLLAPQGVSSSQAVDRMMRNLLDKWVNTPR